MEQSLKTYRVKVTCTNCGTEIDLEIPKGTTVKSFTAKEVCSNCGYIIDFVFSPYTAITTVGGL